MVVLLASMVLGFNRWAARWAPGVLLAVPAGLAVPWTASGYPGLPGSLVDSVHPSGPSQV